MNRYIGPCLCGDPTCSYCGGGIPHPLAEEVRAILEDADVGSDICDAVDTKIEEWFAEPEPGDDPLNDGPEFIPERDGRCAEEGCERIPEGGALYCSIHGVLRDQCAGGRCTPEGGGTFCKAHAPKSGPCIVRGCKLPRESGAYYCALHEPPF